jgi:broad specificity phosphatase PhoE
MNCPNKNDSSYKELESIFGIGKALSLFHYNEDSIPSPQQAIEQLHPGVATTHDALRAWEQGTYAGKDESKYEKEIEDIYTKDPNAKIGGGESFNEMTHRALTAFKDILDNAPANSLVVSHSSAIKALDVWEKEGRPADLKIDPKKYRDQSTQTGELEKYQGKNGVVYVARHGETSDNRNSTLRTDDAKLTDKGIKQAEKLANKLADTPISHVYVSSLPRAIHTADIILNKQNPIENVDLSNVYYQLDPLEAIDRIVKGFKALKPKYLYGKFIGYGTPTLAGNTAIAKKIAKWLEGKSAFSNIQVFTSDEGVLKFRDKSTGQFYYLEDINNNINQIKNEIRNELSGAGKKTEGDTIQTAIYYFSEGYTSSKGVGEGSTKSKSKGSFLSYVKENGLLYKGEPVEDLQYIGKGQEQSTYLSKDGKNVIKVNDGSSYKNWNEYLSNLIVHNKIFPSTEYKLLGFRVLDNGIEVEAIIQQPYVEKTEETDLIKLRELLKSNGFEPWGSDEKKAFNYYNKELGIHIDDLHAQNIIVSHGIPFIIDSRCWVDGNLWKEDNIYYKQLNKQVYDRRNEMEDSESDIEGGHTRYSNRLSNLYRTEEEGADITGKPNGSRRESGRDTGTTENGESGRYRVDTAIAMGRLSRGNTGTSNAEDGSKVDAELDKRVERMLTKIGVDVNRVKDEGQWHKGMADTVNGVIEVVEGRADIKTLSHEATHMFLDLLPADSKLLKEIVDDVKNRPEYDKVHSQYKNNKQYQNADGSVNEEKMAKEAATHIIDQIIVDRFKDKKAMKWWQKLWNWIKGLFKGQNLDMYSQVAEDILSGNTKKLDKDLIKKMKEANAEGKVYYQHDERDLEYLRKVHETATEKQKMAMDDLVFNNPMKLVEDDATNTHKHVDTDNPEVQYKSVTEQINGKTHLDPEDYKLNRDVGKDFDNIMQDIALGKNIDQIGEMKVLTPEQVKEAYDINSQLYAELVSPGDIVLTQVEVYDPISRTAGAIDLLIVKPDGSRKIVDLKTMRMGRPYTTPLGAGEGAVITEPLSRKMKHAIQVATYRRLLGVMGYPNSDISAVYVDLMIEGEGREQVLHGFRKGEEVTFTESSWDTYARQIVPTEVTVDKTKPGELFTEEEVTPDDRIDTTPNTAIPLEADMRLERALDQVVKVFEDRLRYFKSMLQGGSGLVPSKSTIADINNLLLDIDDLRQKGQKSAAYGKVLTHVQNEINLWSKYINNKANFTEPQYYNVVDEMNKFLDSYNGIVRIKTGTTPEQEKMVQQVILSSEQLNQDVAERSWQYVTQKIVEKNPNLPLDTLNSILKEQRDISLMALNTADLAGSRDRIAATLDLMVKEALDKRERAKEVMHDKIYNAGNRFYKVVGPKMDRDTFSFMYQKDKNGNSRIINPIDDRYYRDSEEAYGNMLDDKGEMMQYRQVKDARTATAEDLEYNKDLSHRKDELRKFTSAEDIVDGKAEDGNYHKFTDEYKAARSKVQRLVNRQYISQWERKPGISDEEYMAFRRKYQVYNPYWKMIKKKGIPTGVVVWVDDDSAWFPDRQHIIVKDKTNDGLSLVNQDYAMLMNPIDDVGRAKKEAYELYMDVMGNYTNELGPSAQKWMKEGNMVALRANYLMQANEKGVWKVAKRAISNAMTPTIFAHTQVTDETGTARQVIPRMYMGGIQNQKTIVRLVGKIDQLAQDRAANKIGLTEYNKERKELEYQLKIEKAKPTSDELEYDIFKQMIAYSNMAENFIKMAEIEGQARAMVRLIEGKIVNPETGEGRQYYDVNARGQVITQAGTNLPAYKKDPNVVKRVNSYVSQVFYNDPNMTKTQAEVISKKIMNYTSLLGVGLNIFGNINNYLVGKVAGTMEAAAGKFYDRGAYLRAQGEMTTKIIPGVALKLGQPKDGPYGYKKAQTLGEAILDKYRVVREQKSGEGHVSAIGWLPYKGAQAGEYIAQGVPGLAILMSTDTKLYGVRVITNPDTKEPVSIYDAHELIDGKAVLRKGFTETESGLFTTTNYIFEVNKHMHGSYAPEDVTVLQRYALGQIVAQFHKHIFPALRARFAKGYDHITLGEYEGRYASAYEFGKKFYEFDGTWTEKVVHGWQNLSDVQKKNILHDGAEILLLAFSYASYAILAGIAKGLNPDEDPYLKKMVNFMSYQSSRLYSESIALTPTPMGAVQMYQYVKNPMAMTTTLRNFVQAVMTSVELPFQSATDARYQRGVNKGRLKAVHQWNKTLPGLSNLEKWYNLSSETRFSLIGT